MSKEKNYLLFLKKIESLGVNATKLDEKYGEQIKNASFSMNTDKNVAYDGSFLEVILRVLTPYALKLNEMLPEEQRVDKNKLVKICLFHQISKCLMFEPNDNKWEIEKRGLLYKYAKYDYALKCGTRSLVMCLNDFDMKFTDEEVEAMTIMDRSSEDAQAKFYSSELATIIRIANEMVYVTKFNNVNDNKN